MVRVPGASEGSCANCSDSTLCVNGRRSHDGHVGNTPWLGTQIVGCRQARFYRDIPFLITHIAGMRRLALNTWNYAHPLVFEFLVRQVPASEGVHDELDAAADHPGASGSRAHFYRRDRHVLRTGAAGTRL